MLCLSRTINYVDSAILLAKHISHCCQRKIIPAYKWRLAGKQCLMLIQKQNASTTQYYSTFKHSVTWKQPSGYDTGLKIYNPLVKDKVPLILCNEKIAYWYACGPTVYDISHIGHASTYIRLDIMRRILSDVFDIETVLVMGVTDIDDKIILKATSMGQTIDKITKLYEEEFFDSMRKLNVSPPTIKTRVTEHILPIVQFVKTLEQKGLAYPTPDGSVYFDVKKYGKYGVFSSPVEANQEIESGKKCVLDFALWKACKPGEPWWESPWGKGRPGWHVECSSMASQIFGSNFDLHSGGEDLMYPHHENEIAQSCGYHGNDQWVNYWIHTGHLFLAGQGDKMSKSLKNVISVPELLEKYTSNQFRMLCLLTHYRRKLEFSDERMDKAISTLNTIHSLLNRCDLLLKGQLKCQNIPEAEFYEKLLSTRTLIKNALADDFNTPQALAHLMRLIKFINQHLGENRTFSSQESESEGQNFRPIVSTGVFLRNLLQTFGLDISDKVQSDAGESAFQQQFHRAVDSVVITRNRLREFIKNKQFIIESAGQLNIPEDKAIELMKVLYKPLWAMTDQMRADMLANSNIMIQDNTTGSTWCIVESKTKKDNKKVEQPENLSKSSENESSEKKEKKTKKVAKTQDKEEKL